MHTIKQFTETVQAYYDRNGINEKADVKTKEAAPGSVIIEVYTNKLLTYEHMVRVSGILWLLMPVGVPHELVNVVLDRSPNEKKLPGLSDPNTSETMAAVNESGEIVPVPIQPKKKR